MRRIPSIVPMSQDLEQTLEDAQVACLRADEVSSDAHQVAQDMEDSGVVMEIIDPEDEKSLVLCLQKVREQIAGYEAAALAIAS